MIDARDHLCPYCGIDTDAKLAPLRALFPILAVGLAIAIASLLTCCKGKDAAAPRASEDRDPEATASAQREVEPNDTVEQATPLEATARVHGAIAPGERDLYRIELSGSGGMRLHAGVDAESPAGLRIAVIDAAGAPRGEAVTPARIGALGVVAGTYVVEVEGGPAAGEYTLAVETISAGSGVEWEPNDDASQPSELLAFRSAVKSRAGEARTLGATAGRGWWSSSADRDCFALPARLSGRVELAVEVKPPLVVAARIAVWDAPDEQTGERRLLAVSESAALGEPHHLSVGTREWKAPGVVCVSAARGADFSAPYQLEVRAFVPNKGDAVDLEPNDDLRTAQHVPPAARAAADADGAAADLGETGYVLELAPGAADEQPKPKPKPKPKPAKQACSADAKHCCLANGKIVRPGGCQPTYPPGVKPATRRGADGRCVKIECNLKCLPAATTIATPTGEIPISRLAVGDLVWTVAADGSRVAAPLARVEARPVEGPHSVVELTLADGRVARASAGHPTAAGGELGDVAIDDLLDGAKVVERRVVPYDGEHTWDVLPAGPTGQYWADGVLLGSTLR